jgi:hypothetical protein
LSHRETLAWIFRMASLFVFFIATLKRRSIRFQTNFFSFQAGLDLILSPDRGMIAARDPGGVDQDPSSSEIFNREACQDLVYIVPHGLLP